MSAQDINNVHSAGFIVLRDTAQDNSEHVFHIAHDAYFDIGREQLREWLKIEENSISKHHLRFRCVIYDDSSVHVAPMVYVRVLSSNPIVHQSQCTELLDNSKKITRRHGDILLNHQDILQLTETVFLVFNKNQDLHANAPVFDGTRKAEVCYLSSQSQYIITERVLGVGEYGQVVVAVKRDTGRQLACKILSWSYHASDSSAQQLQGIQRRVEKRAKIAREYNILKDLDHPNIIPLEKVICTSCNIYLFQELVTGGDLCSYLQTHVPLLESEATLIALQLMRAIDYLHDRQIVHRDIKTENILITSSVAGARIVLTDFGQSRLMTHTATQLENTASFRMHSVVGTMCHFAPELTRLMQSGWRRGDGYSKAVDVWSLGVVTTAMLAREPLVFGQMERYDVIDVRLRYESNLAVINEGENWKHVSRDAKSFVKECLTLDENARSSIKKALGHRWFTNKHYVSDMNAAYERAIADWRPMERQENIIEHVDTPEITDHSSIKVDSAYFAPHKSSQLMPTSVIPKPNDHILPAKYLHTRLTPQDAKDDTIHKYSGDVPSDKSSELHASPITSQYSSSQSLFRKNRNFVDSHLQYAPPPSSQIKASSSRHLLLENRPLHLGPHDMVVSMSSPYNEDIVKELDDIQNDREFEHRKFKSAIRESVTAYGRPFEMKRQRIGR